MSMVAKVPTLAPYKTKALGAIQQAGVLVSQAAAIVAGLPGVPGPKPIIDRLKALTDLLDKIPKDQHVYAVREARLLLQQANDLYWQATVYHSRLAVAYASGRKFPGTSFDDRYQWAILGVYEAAKRFAPTNGAAFSTYATWWMRAKVFRFMNDEGPSGGGAILPVFMTEKLYAIRQLGSKGATDDDIAEYMQTDVGAIRAARLAAQSQKTCPFNTPIGGGSRVLSDVLADPSVEANPYCDWYDKETLLLAIDLLPERDRYTILHRFGLEDGHTQTLGQIGTVLGVSREYVRQIEIRAIKKLRRLLQGRNTMVVTNENVEPTDNWVDKYLPGEVRPIPHFGNTVQAARKAAGLNGLQLATKILAITNWDRPKASVASSVSNIETRDYGRDDLRLVLCQVLHLDPESFTPGQGSKRTNTKPVAQKAPATPAQLESEDRLYERLDDLSDPLDDLLGPNEVTPQAVTASLARGRDTETTETTAVAAEPSPDMVALQAELQHLHTLINATLDAFEVEESPLVEVRLAWLRGAQKVRLNR